jgi:hypothetical protein
MILESHRNGARWSRPVVASFSGPSSDRQPALSPDGRTLVYVSRRQLPVRPGEPRRYASNLWNVVRTASGWSVPERRIETASTIALNRSRSAAAMFWMPIVEAHRCMEKNIAGGKIVVLTWQRSKGWPASLLSYR